MSGLLPGTDNGNDKDKDDTRTPPSTYVYPLKSIYRRGSQSQWSYASTSPQPGHALTMSEVNELDSPSHSHSRTPSLVTSPTIFTSPSVPFAATVPTPAPLTSPTSPVLTSPIPLALDSPTVPLARLRTASTGPAQAVFNARSRTSPNPPERREQVHEQGNGVGNGVGHPIPIPIPGRKPDAADVTGLAIDMASASLDPTPKPAKSAQTEDELAAAKRATIESFVHDQANTRNVANPNAARASRPEEGRLGLTAAEGVKRGSIATEHDDDNGMATTTRRFKYVETQGGHHVAIGREGEIRRCEEEPITTPGAVQGFGVLIVLEEDEDSGVLSVRQVSENSTELLGLSPHFLFQLESFTDLLDEEQEDILRNHVELLPDPCELEVEDYEGPAVFRLSGRGESACEVGTPLSEKTPDDEYSDWSCWVAASQPQQPLWDRMDSSGNPLPPPNLIILEFELAHDTVNPLHLDDDISGWMSIRHGPAGPEGSDTTRSSFATSTYTDPDGYMPPMDRILESTTNHAKPLRALQGRRGGGPDSRGGGEKKGYANRRRRRPGRSDDAVDVFSVLSQINEQLNTATSLKRFLDMVVGVIKDVSRFHRVLIYQFDEGMNGKVVSELVNMNYTTDLYKGLMFPAADIPPQARHLYVANKVRILYNTDQTTARMVLRDKSDLDYPLDMTHCFLRAMSPIHIKYLSNMSVRSSMSVSIVAFGKLWGLIACHSYGQQGMRVSFPVRQMLRVLSSSISRNVERLTYAQRLDSRRAIHSTGLATLAGFDRKQQPGVVAGKDEQGYITSNASDLLSIFEADGGLLVINDGCKLLGPNEQAHAMLAVAEYFRAAGHDTIMASNSISTAFPDIKLPRVGDNLAGILYVPLTADAGRDFILFFRKGQVRTVNWAGRPYKDAGEDERAMLEPRKSFKLWTEQVRGRAAEWTEEQCEAAAVLAVLYGKFIQVWRDRQSMMATNHLTSILLSNTSHALRTPLSQIINTLELAMAGNIDGETRGMLENSHEASRALLFHVHDLLDLTRVETGNETVFNDPFDLKQTITDTVRLFQKESERRQIVFDLVVDSDLPVMVVGDQRKIRTCISNLTANAVKFTTQGSVKVEVHSAPGETPEQINVEIVIRDTGCGMSPEHVEGMFVTLEGADESGSNNSEEAGTVGLGLAVVGHIVKQLDGQLRVESEVDKGTTVYFAVTLGAIGLNPISMPATAEPQDVSPAIRLSSQAPSPATEHKEVRGTSESSKRTISPETRPQRARWTSPGSSVSTIVPAHASPTVSSQAIEEEKAHKHVHTERSAPAPAPVSAPRPPPPHPSVQPDKIRVLVVEDDIINSRIMCKRLKMDGHVVKSVENGQEAIDALAADWGFDVVLMDIQMPIMDGRQSAREIRSLEAAGKLPAAAHVGERLAHRLNGRIPIIAVSASLYEEDRADIAVSFDGWLLKPLNFPRVRELLKVLQDESGELRAKEMYEAGCWEWGGFFRCG